MLLGEEPYGENPRKARKPGPKLIELIKPLSSLSSLSSPDSMQQRDECHKITKDKIEDNAAKEELRQCLEIGKNKKVAMRR